MQRQNFLTILIPIFFLAGCLQSFNPAYLSEDVIFEPKLVGTWMVKESEESDALVPWTFEDAGGNVYLLSVGGDEPLNLTVTLVQIGDDQYLDFFPTEDALHNSQSEQMVPYHTLYKFALEGNEVSLEPFDYEWGHGMLEQGTIDVAYLESSEVLITPTEELRELLLKYSDEAFSEKDALKLKRAN